MTSERIADAALSLEPGRWSVAAVADRLRVSETAVYRHAANGEQLLVLVIDHVVGRELEPPRPQPGDDGAAYLDRIARHVRTLLRESTGVASAIVTTGWLGSTDHLDRFLERCLTELSVFGFGEVDADAALNLLLNWTVRWVAGEELVAPESEYDDRTNPVATPQLARARKLAPPAEQLFDRHLRSLAIGIVAEFAS